MFALDHNVQSTSKATLDAYDTIRQFAKEHSIVFHDKGRGIGHQIMLEEGFVLPYTLVVASDSHSNMYGGLGALGTPVVRTDAAGIWATGKTWWQIPPVSRIHLSNTLPKGVTGKDVIIALCGILKEDQVLNHALEFTGSGAHSLEVSDRLAIANMTTEWGALAGVFPVDDKTLCYLETLKKRLGENHVRLNSKVISEIEKNPITADRDAFYHTDISLDLSSLSPMVSGPNSVKLATPVCELEKIPIQKAYLVSCVNSRLPDLELAASILKNRKVHETVSFYVAPASSVVREDAQSTGAWQVLIDAGAKVLPAGCGPCVGLGAGLLEDGEVGISATNRNFKGRMGSIHAKCYLASPSVVAQSALDGFISSPVSNDTAGKKPSLSYRVNDSNQIDSTPPTFVSGFPKKFVGECMLVLDENINTDVIYPGKYTYIDVPLSDMPSILLSNYDSTFADTLKSSRSTPILIVGANFGTGSSREQAATAILASGIKIVIAPSFSQTFKRNAWNNGLCVLEADVASFFREKGFGGKKSEWSGEECVVDLESGFVIIGNTKIPIKSKIGQVAQELVVEGGLESWIKNRISQ